VAESLTTDLSRISGSFVIARNSAFSYKGKSIDVRQVGRELNVRYALEGSVQRGGGRFRVNVQLIDAETGNHLWAGCVTTFLCSRGPVTLRWIERNKSAAGI
jgi:TolB-like protein